MNREEKQQVVDEVRQSLERSKVGVVTYYRGLTVGEMTQLRRELRNAGVEYRVIKNTLARIATKGTAFEPLNGMLSGPTAVALSSDPVAPAKVLSAFAKKQPKLEIVGGVLEGKAMTPAGIAALAELPSREMLLAQLLGTMNAPIGALARVLAAVPGGLVRCLDQIRQQKEEAA